MKGISTKAALAALLGLCVLGNSACVTGRRSVPLTVPDTAVGEVKRGPVYLGEVVDKRKFENAPRDPSIPSIDGDVGKLTPDLKQTFIGRQRNGFGKAMGDIALGNGQTVPGLARSLVTEALENHGYVLSTVPANKSATVAVDEFWAWGTPGAFSVSFEARVGTTLTISGAANPPPSRSSATGSTRGRSPATPIGSSRIRGLSKTS